MKTTAPAAASTVAPDSNPPCLALVIAWSASQPQRVGQIAFFPFGERLFVGRGDDALEEFAHFVQHRPGETPAVDPHEEVLGGDSISRRQLQVRSAGHQLEVERIGRCRTYVNGVELTSATVLGPGDTLLLKGELLLLCVLRPRTLALPPGLRELHAFGEPDADGIVGEGPAAWTLRAQLAQAAGMRDHVLIQGESGTGKELAAGVIRNRSRRAKAPLVSANAKALPEALVAAELFGNLKDYPNPGMHARPGLVGAAHGGTLLLDEIGELSLDAQAQMLRVLDKGECLALGDPVARRVDIRLVGATNRGDDAFRPDFLARFNARVYLPALRLRREDIPLLLRQLLLARARETPKLRARLLIETPGGRLEPRVSARLVEYLLHHPLPTNVREMDKILLAAIHAGGDEKLTVPPGAPQLTAGHAVPVPDRPLEGDPPKEVLEAALRRHNGNIARVARELGLSRPKVYRLMKDYGLEREGEPRK